MASGKLQTQVPLLPAGDALATDWWLVGDRDRVGSRESAVSADTLAFDNCLGKYALLSVAVCRVSTTILPPHPPLMILQSPVYRLSLRLAALIKAGERERDLVPNPPHWQLITFAQAKAQAIAVRNDFILWQQLIGHKTLKQRTLIILGHNGGNRVIERIDGLLGIQER